MNRTAASERKRNEEGGGGRKKKFSANGERPIVDMLSEENS